MNTLGKRQKPTIARLFVLCLFTVFVCLSYNAKAQYQINGNAAQTACNCWRLTTANNSQNGSVWNVNLFDLNNPFNFTFDVFLGCNDGGADGLAFVLQPLSVNAGSSGGGIGYAGINPSLAVEMDNYQNGGEPSWDHMAIQQNGDVSHGGPNTLAGPVQISAATGNIEDCAWHVLNITWDPATQTMTVYFDGVLRLSYTGDIINNIFGGNPNVYWGFTSATGGANNLHQFCNSLNPAFIITSPIQCEGTPVDFESASVVATGLITDYQWDFGDGNTGTGTQVSHVFPGPGNYTVTLTITSEGCTESSSVVVTINPDPAVDLGLDQAICDGDSYQINTLGLAGGETLQWTPITDLDNPAVANPTASPSSTTSYTLDVTDANGCSASDDIEITVNPLPVADAGPDQTICDGEVTAMAASGGTTYAWNPGIGLVDATSPTTGASPVATTNYGLTVTDANGCQDTDAMTITVNPLPIVSAGMDNSICDEQTVQLSASGALNYIWTPTTGLDNTTISNPTFSGNSTTTFVVTGTDANGCEATDDVEITVFPLPIADFDEPANVCLGNPTIIVDNSAGNAITYSWNFGDGSPIDNSVLPTHTYASDGNFTINLSLTDANGCQASTSEVATVLALPTAVMNLNDGVSFCEGEEIQFEDLSPGSGLDILWDFGDNAFLPAFPNSTSTESNPTFAYSNFAFGPYTVSLNVIDAAGCFDQDQTVIIIHDNPSANFSATTVCEGNATNFIDASSVFVSTVDTWNWNFGDNVGTSSVQNPNYTYQDSGAYVVQLDVITNDGCSASITQNVLVNPTPEVAISGIDTCHNDETAFANNTSPQDATIDQWVWNFGDGTLSSNQVAAYTYPDFGDYTVSLTATTDSGCVASATTDISVFPNPEPAFEAVEAVGCTPHEVLFVNQSTLATGLLSTYSWDFGDSTTTTSPNPIHTYQDSGYYDITLTATSTEGCVTEIIVNDAIRANITPNAGFNILEDRLSLLDAEAVFTDESQHALLWDWNFGNGELSSAQNPTTSYTEPGTYDVILVVTNGDCQDEAYGQVKVDPIVTFYIPSAFTPDADGVNETFYGTGESIKDYNMKISDRWGMLLFESNDQEFHWDGTYLGKPVDIGVYIYEFNLVDDFGNQHRKIGHVTLLR